MKILLAPSETKKHGGIDSFDPSSLLFKELMPNRIKLLHAYTNVLQQGDLKKLSKMFGLKKESDILLHKQDIIHSLTMKAIERYTGVAFKYLGYDELSKSAQGYVDNNVIVFSNLFGPIRANDLIPDYKLKQGELVDNIRVEKYYREHSEELMQEYLKDEQILDLRAGFYNKFYKPKKEYTTLKFIKEGKVVSHWAKAYRGIVLREIAKNEVESLEEFMKLEIENLQVKEIVQKGLHTEVVYDIV